MKERGEKKNRRSTRGESMVVAVVLMLVFFILGIAVLTGASVANASVNARVRYRQAYYYARSTLELLDYSLRFGELGEWVRDYERDALGDAGLTEPDAALIESRTLNIPISFGQANVPEGLSFVDGATLSYDVVSRYLAGDPMISLGNVRLSFRVAYAGRTYGATTTYSYRGSYNTDQGIWEHQQWRLRSMS